MPSGHYIRTKEYREIMSKAQKRIGNRPPIASMHKSSNWKGGKILRANYYYIKTVNHPLGGKQGYVAEHRLVMEKHLGRYLTRREVVHHINGIRTDNRIENLELCESAGQHVFKHHPEAMRNNPRLIKKGERRSIATEFGNRPAWNKGMKMDKTKFPHWGNNRR